MPLRFNPFTGNLDIVETVAHDLLSASHSDALAAAVVRGDIIYGNATPKWARKAIGMGVLVGDGTDVVGWTQAPALTTPSMTSPTVSVALSTPSIITAAGALTVTPAAGSNLNIALATTGDFAVNTNQLYVDTSIANVAIGHTAPTARLHLAAGTATASSAPLKFNSGTVLTTAEAGAIEFNTDDFFATITTGAARKALVLDNGSRLTSGRIPVATTNGRLIDGLTPVRGDIAISNSTPAWTSLTIGSNQTILVSNGSDPSWVGSFTVSTSAGVDAWTFNSTATNGGSIAISTSGNRAGGFGSAKALLGVGNNTDAAFFSDNTLYYVPASGAGTITYSIVHNNTGFVPYTDNGLNLGSAANRWSQAWLNPAGSGVGDTYICLKTDGQVRTGATCAASTRKIKKNVKPVISALKQIVALMPVSFDYTKGFHGGRADVGFIIEDTALINPALAFYASDDELLSNGEKIKQGDPISPNTNGLLALAIGAIKEQQAIIEVLTARLDTLRG